MDIKIGGITPRSWREALEQARAGRLHILDEMAEALAAAARRASAPYAPRILTIKVPVDKIRDIIGPGGKMIRSIVERTGCKIDVEDDGRVSIASVDEAAARKAIAIIEELTATAELNKTYLGKVVRVVDFGAFVEILPGTDGLLHVSEMAAPPRAGRAQRGEGRRPDPGQGRQHRPLRQDPPLAQGAARGGRGRHARGRGLGRAARATRATRGGGRRSAAADTTAATAAGAAVTATGVPAAVAADEADAAAAGTAVATGTDVGRRRLAGLALLAVAQATAGALPAGPSVEVSVTRRGFEPARITLRRGETARLVLQSGDGEHCFAVDALRIEKRVVNGRPTRLELTPGAHRQLPLLLLRRERRPGRPRARGDRRHRVGLLAGRRIDMRALVAVGALRVVAILAGLAGEVGAQDVRPLVLRVGGLVDGTGKPLRKDVILVVQGERIAEIRDAKASDSSDAEGSTVVDLGEFFVLPGLIDAHAHITQSHDPKLDFGELSAAACGILGVVHAKRTLMAGFTTVRDPSGPYYADVALRDAINAGWVEGPRMFVSGPVITMTGGHGAVGNWAPPGVEVQSGAMSVADGADGVRREVRTHQKYGVDFIKVVATGGIFTARSDPGAASYTREELEAAVDEARKRGQRVAAHAHGLEGIRNAVLAGAHSIEHGSFLDAETTQLMVERGTFLVPDVYADEYILTSGKELGIDPAMLEKARAVSARFRESATRAHKAGVKIAFGTDAGVYPHGENAKQFQLYVDLGMSPGEAIATATRHAAELIGVSADLGTIEVGKYADLVAVPRNPLEDARVLETIPFVMKGGRIVKNETSCRKALVP